VTEARQAALSINPVTAHQIEMFPDFWPPKF
jgi:hypothetical protein